MIIILQPGLGYRPAPGVSPSKHARNLRLYLWTKASGRCALCDMPLEPNEVSPDHIVPKSKGGGDGVDNLQATHWPCNSRKSNHPMIEAVREIRTGVKEYRPPVRRQRRVVPAPAPAVKIVERKKLQDYRLSCLQSVREAKGWSHDDLARETGLAVGTIVRIERAEYMPRISSLRKLADALGVQPAELLGPEY